MKKIVMERVVKRYLMHNQGDIDDLKLNDFDELKQDLQLMKTEFVNDIYKSKDDIIKNIHFLTNSIKFIAEDILLHNITNPNSRNESHEKYRNLMNFNETLLNSPLMGEESSATAAAAAAAAAAVTTTAANSSASTTTTTTAASSASTTASSSRGEKTRGSVETIVFNNDKCEAILVNDSSSSPSSSPAAGLTPIKKKIDFIDNLLSPRNASTSSKATPMYEMTDNRFFPNSSSGPLYKIVEETTSISRTESNIMESFNR
jgi:hypothetical protein